MRGSAFHNCYVGGKIDISEGTGHFDVVRADGTVELQDGGVTVNNTIINLETKISDPDCYVSETHARTWAIFGTGKSFFVTNNGNNYTYYNGTISDLAKGLLSDLRNSDELIREGVIFMEPYKYLTNFIDMWYLTILLLVGVVLVLYAIGKTIISKDYIQGIWPAGIGVVLVVLPLLLMSAWNHTAYYPSTADLQSSLTLANSCSSEFTLRTMFYVSLLIPFVLAYIAYAWYSLDKKKLDKEEIADGHAY